MKRAFLSFIFLASSVFADQAAAPARENNLMQTLMMIGVAVFFFYFILWRPEQKRRKAMEEQRNSLKKGDRVTAMGIIGTVVSLRDKENSVILKMVDGSKIEVLKAAITDVQPGANVTVEEESKSVDVQAVEATSDSR